MQYTKRAIDLIQDILEWDDAHTPGRCDAPIYVGARECVWLPQYDRLIRYMEYLMEFGLDTPIGKKALDAYRDLTEPDQMRRLMDFFSRTLNPLEGIA